jgi:peroxiredoxin
MIEKHSNFENLYIEYVKNGGIEYSDRWVKKKVWMLKENQMIQKMRVETSFLNPEQPSTLHIMNGKQQLFINSASKRSDVFNFNLLKEDKLDEFYSKQEADHLPSFMIKEGSVDDIVNEMYEYFKNSGNVSIRVLNDTLISEMPCFGIQITDSDKNNGYISDKTNGNEKYAEKTIETTYFRKSDTLIALRKTDFMYANPFEILSQTEQLYKYNINQKQNENIHLYAIKTDTLKDYFQTITRFNGAENETVLADFSLKKAPLFSAKTLKDDFLELNTFKGKMILLVFWSLENEATMLQLSAINDEYSNLKEAGLEVIAINSSDQLTEKLQQHLLKIEYQFPVIFSEIIGSKYLVSDTPAFFLLDKDLKIKDIFYQINQVKIDKILKMLK